MNFVSSRGLSSAGSVGAGRATVVGGDEKSLREFLALHLGAMAFATGETTVTIGALPVETLWFDLPLPDGAQVIGTVAREQGGVEILLLTPLERETATEAIQTALAGAGWSFLEDWPGSPRGGFVDTTSVIMRRLCNEDAGATLLLSVGAVAGGSTLRLHVNREKQPCQPMTPPYAHHVQDMPTLETPPGARLNPKRSGSNGGGGTGERQFSSLAALTTDQAVVRLAEWYDAQLRAQGWQPVDATVSAQVAASVWSKHTETTQSSATLTLAVDPLASGDVTLALQVYERDV